MKYYNQNIKSLKSAEKKLDKMIEKHGALESKMYSLSPNDNKGHEKNHMEMLKIESDMERFMQDIRKTVRHI